MTHSYHDHKHEKTVRKGLQKPNNPIVGVNLFPVREKLMSITELGKQNKLYVHSSIYTKINENCPE